ncbi:unnamed protein product, partial [Symbiodinium sp. CCMP2456]
MAREDDYPLRGSESFATNYRHLQELHGLSAFQQVVTKVPPSYDGRGNWFAYEDAIDDWCDITELDNDERGPALRNRLEGEAALHKRLLDRDRLKDPDNRVKYLKSFLRPLFVKGAATVFLYRFQQFMNLHTEPNNAEVRAYVQGLDLTNEQAMDRANDEEDGTEGFLEADDDSVWVYDQENYTCSRGVSKEGRCSEDSRAAAKEKEKVAKDPEE